MNRWREANHRGADSARSHGNRRFFRGHSRKRGGAGSRCVFFGCEAARRDDGGPGGDDQGAVRASERGTESLDGAPIRFTVRRVFREVVDEGRVNHALASPGARGEALKILKRTTMDISSCRCKGRGSRIRPSQAKYLVSRGDQFSDDGGTDESRRAGNKVTQNELPQV